MKERKGRRGEGERKGRGEERRGRGRERGMREENGAEGG